MAYTDDWDGDVVEKPTKMVKTGKQLVQEAGISELELHTTIELLLLPVCESTPMLEALGEME